MEDIIGLGLPNVALGSTSGFGGGSTSVNPNEPYWKLINAQDSFKVTIKILTLNNS